MQNKKAAIVLYPHYVGLTKKYLHERCIQERIWKFTSQIQLHTQLKTLTPVSYTHLIYRLLFHNLHNYLKTPLVSSLSLNLNIYFRVPFFSLIFNGCNFLFFKFLLLFSFKLLLICHCVPKISPFLSLIHIQMCIRDRSSCVHKD